MDYEPTYRVELLNTCVAEILRLAPAHFNETSRYKHAELDPNLPEYRALESAGWLRIYTARLGTIPKGQLIGYNVFALYRPIHCRNDVRAREDVFFVDPTYRGIGGSFITWGDRQLVRDGARVVYRDVQLSHDYSLVLKRAGYEPQQVTWSKPLPTTVAADAGVSHG